MRSHRAGKWSFNAVYAQILLETGYSVDCSVTPHVSWKHALGDPQQSGGTDYTSFPEVAYFMDLADISKPGRSSLLEVPTTIVRARDEIGVIKSFRACLKDGSRLKRIFNRFFPQVHWLRPNGRNLKAMLNILTQARQEKRAYVEFMLHSSEFLPGGSPKFRHQKDIEALYDTLEALFSTASQTFKGRHSQTIMKSSVANQITPAGRSVPLLHAMSNHHTRGITIHCQANTHRRTRGNHSHTRLNLASNHPNRAADHKQDMLSQVPKPSQVAK